MIWKGENTCEEDDCEPLNTILFEKGKSSVLVDGRGCTKPEGKVCDKNYIKFALVC